MEKLNELLNSQLALLTRPQAYLRRSGVHDVFGRRLEDTWHRSALSSHWARTIGMWGGVTTHDEILKRAGVSYDSLKMFRQRNALMTRPQRSQWDLAASSFLKWTLDGADDLTNAPMMVASHFGILPIELRIYVDRMKAVIMELNIEATDLLEDSNYARVEEPWAAHSAAIDGFVLSTYAQVTDG